MEWRTSTHYATRPSAQRRRRGDPTLLFAFTAVLATIVAIAAGITFQRNAGRFDRYRDPSCTVGVAAPPPVAHAPDAVCSTDSAQLVDHWIHNLRRGADYFYALRLSNGDVDTVFLESRTGATPRSVWQRTPLGAHVAVQRFRETATQLKPHITLVQVANEEMRTGWNPVSRSGDALVGVVVFSLIALGCAFSAWHSHGEHG